MTEERTKSYYKSFTIISAFYKGEFRATAHHKFTNRLEVRKAVDIKNALQRIHEQIDSYLAKNEDAIRAHIIEQHKKFIQSNKYDYTGVRKITIFRRVNHCYSCKRPVDNAYDLECNSCSWIVCSYCGSCGCGYCSY